MKKSLTLVAAIGCFTFGLFSCKTSRNSLASDKLETEITSGTVTSNFVQYLDGSIQSFQSLKLITGVLVTPHLLADGKKLIYAKDIKAYQDNQHYAISQQLMKTKRKSHVAKETLPGFAVRVISGKLNVYKRTIYNGERAVEQFFLQQGAEGAIVAYTDEVMKDILRANTEVLNYFNTRAGKENLFKKLQTTVYLFNNDLAVTKN